MHTQLYLRWITNKVLLQSIGTSLQYYKQLNREREILYDIAYKQNLKGNDTNELTKQKQTSRLRE